MSFITAIIIKNRRFRIYKRHYREIIDILKTQKFSGNCFLQDYFDDGYLIVDFDNSRIYNSQSCFDPNKDVKKLSKFEIIRA